MHKPDGLVGDDVRETLAWDNAIDDTRIMVHVKDGKVTLSGAVHTYSEALKALEDTKHVKGVRDLDNQLLVGPAGEAVADAALVESCNKALDENPFVPKGAVSVTVRDGWVTLSGDVRHHHQRDAAEDAVSWQPGVTGITNDLKMTPNPIPSDVADRINRAIDRNSILDDSVIKVSNQGSTIYLDGEVNSYLARVTAEDAAWNAPGVGDVVDRLLVTS
jgi:osmotically-inducible protein OsmY